MGHLNNQKKTTGKESIAMSSYRDRATLPPNIVLRHIKNRDAVTPEDLATYSRMKHGDPEAAQYFAEQLADVIYGRVFESKAVDIDEELIITSSAYGAVPTASYAIMKIVAKILTERGVKLWEIKINREGDFATTHYGSMSMKERQERMASRRISIDDETREAIKGKIVLVIDDVNVTGSHEESLRALFATTDIRRHIFCYLFSFYKTLAALEPQAEDWLNHGVIQSLFDLLPFFGQPGRPTDNLVINARVLKFILNTDGLDADGKVNKLLELKEFLLRLDDQTLIKLYQASTSADGYYQRQKFIDGFHVLADVIVSRRLVPITEIHRLKNNTVFRFVTFDDEGNLVNMVTGENESELGRNYSLMKFGSAQHINWFGQKTAEAFIARLEDPGDNLIEVFRNAQRDNGQIVMISPGSRNVESAQNFVFDQAVARINVYLALHNLPTIVMLKLSRFGSGIANYAELSLSERYLQERRNSQSQYIMPGQEFFDLGLHVIFADDVRITGSAADRAENVCRQRQAHSFVSLYSLVVDPKITLQDPSVENRLNLLLINGELNEDTTYILNQDGFRPVQRMMRLVLGEKNRSKLGGYLRSEISDQAILKIYQAALGNDFYKDSRYADSVPILTEVLFERGLIDAKGLVK